MEVGGGGGPGRVWNYAYISDTIWNQALQGQTLEARPKPRLGYDGLEEGWGGATAFCFTLYSLSLAASVVIEFNIPVSNPLRHPPLPPLSLSSLVQPPQFLPRSCGSVLPVRMHKRIEMIKKSQSSLPTPSKHTTPLTPQLDFPFRSCFPKLYYIFLPL